MQKLLTCTPSPAPLRPTPPARREAADGDNSPAEHSDAPPSPARWPNRTPRRGAEVTDITAHTDAGTMAPLNTASAEPHASPKCRSYRHAQPATPHPSPRTLASCVHKLLTCQPKTGAGAADVPAQPRQAPHARCPRRVQHHYARHHSDNERRRAGPAREPRHVPPAPARCE